MTTRIFESERNRPAELTPPVPAGDHVPSSTFDLSPPRDPLEVGSQVLYGIRHKQLHIFTDMKVQGLIEARHRRMMAEFDRLAEWEKINKN